MVGLILDDCILWAQYKKGSFVMKVRPKLQSSQFKCNLKRHCNAIAVRSGMVVCGADNARLMTLPQIRPISPFIIGLDLERPCGHAAAGLSLTHP